MIDDQGRGEATECQPSATMQPPCWHSGHLWPSPTFTSRRQGFGCTFLLMQTFDTAVLQCLARRLQVRVPAPVTCLRGACLLSLCLLGSPVSHNPKTRMRAEQETLDQGPPAPLDGLSVISRTTALLHFSTDRLLMVAFASAEAHKLPLSSRYFPHRCFPTLISKGDASGM